jgi:hypothetical protein
LKRFYINYFDTESTLYLPPVRSIEVVEVLAQALVLVRAQEHKLALVCRLVEVLDMVAELVHEPDKA